MKSQVTILQAILIFSVITALAVTVFPWGYKIIQGSMDAAEIEKIKSEFLDCSNKILETARTGTGNKCILTVNRGELEAKRDGIYYSLLSEQEICSEHEWEVIETGKQLWQRCKVNGQYLYQLKWLYPENDVILLFGDVKVTTPSGEREYYLTQKGVLLVEFYSPEALKGRTIELTRYSVEENKTVLKINIY